MSETMKYTIKVKTNAKKKAVEEGPHGDALVAGLQARSHAITRPPPWCNVQAVRRACDKLHTCVYEAVSDPRQEGGAVAE